MKLQTVLALEQQLRVALQTQTTLQPLVAPPKIHWLGPQMQMNGVGNPYDYVNPKVYA